MSLHMTSIQFRKAYTSPVLTFSLCKGANLSNCKLLVGNMQTPEMAATIILTILI
jgi:hypothetical protein